jgi:hypothetical protein
LWQQFFEGLSALMLPAVVIVAVIRPWNFRIFSRCSGFVASVTLSN